MSPAAIPARSPPTTGMTDDLRLGGPRSNHASVVIERRRHTPTRIITPGEGHRRFYRPIPILRPMMQGWFALRRLQASASESKLGNVEDWESASEPLEVTAVSRIRGTQGIQEDTKGHDELGD